MSSGARFAGYTMVGLLGPGRVGQVYLAEHPRASAPRRSQDPGRRATSPAHRGSARPRPLPAPAAGAAGKANGDDTAYRDYRDRYCAMANSLGFEGHIDWAKAMIEGGEQSVNRPVA